jgi:hypothetical protein
MSTRNPSRPAPSPFVPPDPGADIEESELELEEGSEELRQLAGETALGEDPIPDDAHLEEVERLAGNVHPGDRGPVAHERLSTRPEEMAARQLEEDLAADEQLDIRMRPPSKR